MKPLSRHLYAVVAITLAAVIFVALNIAADDLLTSERLDLTENGVFSLSAGTKHILANLKEPITLKFYYSKEVGAGYAQINAYAKRVHDLLGEYVSRSGGKVVLEEIDPQPFSQEEDEAAADGVKGRAGNNNDVIYFGLAGTNTIDGKETISFFSEDREGYLEYDITSLIYKLATPKKPVLGVISGLPLDTGAGGMQAALQGQSRPFLIYEELTQLYTTKMLDPNFSSIPPGIDMLMIVDPGTMAPAQLYAIDQFVLKGGHALVFVDPLSQLASAGQSMGGESAGPTSSDLPSLFRAWGIAYDPTKVVADLELAIQVPDSSDPRNSVVAYPIWLSIDSHHASSKDAVTGNIQSINLADVGALYPRKGATTNFTPLLWSSDKAGLLDADSVRASSKVEDLIAQIEPTGQAYTIAARISGPARTSFPNGSPLPPADASKAGPEVKASKGPINVIVVADTDIFDDRFWVNVENIGGGQRLAQPFADNFSFVVAAVENLMGSSDLISLRTRASNARPFVVVQKLRAAAEAQDQRNLDILKKDLADTEAELRALQQGTSANGQQAANALSPEQQAEIEKYRRHEAQTRTALRDVEHNLNRNVDRLGAVLAFVNIALMPILVSIAAVTLAVLRRRRRARAIAM